MSAEAHHMCVFEDHDLAVGAVLPCTRGCDQHWIKVRPGAWERIPRPGEGGEQAEVERTALRIRALVDLGRAAALSQRGAELLIQSGRLEGRAALELAQQLAGLRQQVQQQEEGTNSER